MTLRGKVNEKVQDKIQEKLHEVVNDKAKDLRNRRDAQLRNSKERSFETDTPDTDSSFEQTDMKNGTVAVRSGRPVEKYLGVQMAFALPIISSFVKTFLGIYNKIRNLNRLVAWTFSKVEGITNSVMSIGMIRSPLQLADVFLLHTLNFITSVASATGSFFRGELNIGGVTTEVINSIKRVILTMSDIILSTKLGSLVPYSIGLYITAAMKILDLIFPPTEDDDLLTRDFTKSPTLHSVRSIVLFVSTVVMRLYIHVILPYEKIRNRVIDIMRSHLPFFAAIENILVTLIKPLD